MESKEKYTLRKSSKYKNVYSVGLGVFVATAVGGITSGEASAHEVENANTSTNLTEIQTESTSEHSYTLENTGKQTGDMNVNVDSSKLDKQVDEAKKMGLIVNKTENKDFGTSITPDETNKKAGDIAKDYNTQATEIEKTISNYKAEKEKHKAEVEKITLENKAIMEKYKADVVAYNKKVKEVQAHNKAVQDKYDKELVDFNANVEKINKENATAKAEYEKAYKDYLAKMKKFEEDNKKKEEAHKLEVAKYEKEKSKIQTDNATAKDAFAKATEKYNKDKAAAEKTNADAIAKHKQDLAKYEKDKANIEKSNKDKQDKYNQDLAKYNNQSLKNTEDNKNIEIRNKAKQEKYNKELEKYNKEKEKYDSELSKIKNSKQLMASTDGIKVYGHYDENNRNSIDYYSKIEVVGDKTLKDVSILKDYLGWHENTSVTRYSGNYTIEQKEWEGYNDGWRITNHSNGDKYKINNIGTLTDGRTIHAIVTIKDVGRVLDGDNTRAKHLDVYGYLTSNVIGFSAGNSREVEQEFSFVDNDGEEVNLLMTSIVVDVDYTQGSKFTYNKSNTINLIPRDSGLTYENGMVLDKENLEAENISSVPTASFVSAGFGNKMTYKHIWTYDEDRYIGPHAPEKNQGNVFVFDLFGDVGNIKQLIEPNKPTPPTLENKTNEPNKPTPPKLDKVPNKPSEPKLVGMPKPPVPPVEKPTPDKPIKPGVDPAPVKPIEPKEKALPKPPVRGVDNVVPPKPGDPKFREIPKDPVAPVINYNYANLTVKPNVLKTAINTNNESIDNSYVAKASTVKWELKTEKLPANRQEITSFVITDSLPSGFELDLAKTKEVSKDFNVKYNKTTNTAVFKLNKTALKELNANLNSEYTPKFPTAIGTVMNDGATYENTFKLEIEEKLPNLGNVIINYVDESGNPLSESITDVKDGEVGEGYDTTDNKPLQIAKGGKVYKLINVQGTEIGKIVQGDTEVTYVYKETPPAPNTGTVVIHFIDEEGNPLKDDNFIHNGVKVGSDYDTSKYVTSTITKNGIEYKYTEKVDGVEKGKVTEGVTEVTYVYKRVTPEKPGKSYTKYSNKVKVYTPGKSKTPPPTGTDGTPGDPTKDPNRDPIAPVKKVTNSEGVDINNTVTTIGQTLHYTLEWDLDQYKNIKVTAEDIARGFYYVDDFPDDVLITDDAKVTFTDTQGNTISGIKVETFDSFDKVPDKAKEVLSRAMITPKGAFQLFSVENPQEFFDNYVSKGVDILIHNPMYVKSVKDNVEYINKGYQIDFGNGYETNEVTNKVETPDPGKENTNKDGVNINGKSVLPGTVNYYKLTWDLDQYKGMKAGADEVGKGFYFVDDFPEEALTINDKGITLTDSNGSPVTGVTMTIYESLEKAPDNIKHLLAKTNIKGAFQVFSADNPTEFFNKYVTTGTNITISNPMTINENIFSTGGEFSNIAYQIDFNSIFETETVVNNVPKIEPTKDVVLDAKDTTSFDGKAVEVGKVFNYKLTGAKLPANRGDSITQYGFVDDYDEFHDKYDGHYIVIADTDIAMKDGTVIKKGEEITKHSIQQHNNGVVSIEMNQDFLAGVSENSEFGASAYIQVERAKSGENIKNVYTNIINGMESLSNTVTSNTPEPPKPTPKKEIPPVPVVQPAPPVVKELPKTDSNSTSGAVALATGLAGAALVASKRRKRPKFR